MAQHAIELILMRQLASGLVTPIFLVNPRGDLLFYNEPAEVILGCRFDETGMLPVEQWSTMFVPTDAAGRALPPESLPLVMAITDRRPAHRAFWIEGLDGVSRHIEVTAFPLIGQADRMVGAVAIFWERAPA